MMKSFEERIQQLIDKHRYLVDEHGDRGLCDFAVLIHHSGFADGMPSTAPQKAKTSEAARDAQHEFNGPHGWIQWKGTDVCMDVHCACGEMTHIDDDFVYHVECVACGRVYFCNGNIELIELEETPGNCVKMTCDD